MTNAYDHPEDIAPLRRTLTPASLNRLTSAERTAALDELTDEEVDDLYNKVLELKRNAKKHITSTR